MRWLLSGAVMLSRGLWWGLFMVNLFLLLMNIVGYEMTGNSEHIKLCTLAAFSGVLCLWCAVRNYDD